MEIVGTKDANDSWLEKLQETHNLLADVTSFWGYDSSLKQGWLQWLLTERTQHIQRPSNLKMEKMCNGLNGPMFRRYRKIQENLMEIDRSSSYIPFPTLSRIQGGHWVSESYESHEWWKWRDTLFQIPTNQSSHSRFRSTKHLTSSNPGVASIRPSW